MRAAIALAALIIMCAAMVAAAEDAPAPGSGAAAFCKSSQPKSCGWAGEEEWSQTEQGNCWLCGTVWYGFGPGVPLPTVVDLTSTNYYQYAGQAVSLGCRPGKVVVRIVHKPLVTQDGCSSSYRLVSDGLGRNEQMMRGATPVQRCELQLPPHTPADETEVADETEIEAALSSTEVNCKPCVACDDCPGAVEGAWYSDTFYATFHGCDAVAKLKGEPYEPFMPSVAINAGAKFLLAKFEVQEAD
ncbi:hypothetical protein FOA52_006822 [Chlamydomonas sp. UWO 241]|nr:hypothetical protein FOA52_006822 [Chlamydomonas sp. UWO 241]